MGSYSTRRPAAGKAGRRPKRPRKDFPLRIHKGTGYWCKKVRGHVYYFGRVADDPEAIAALEEWRRVEVDLRAGREPPSVDLEALTVEVLCFRFLEHKEGLRNNGELNPRTYAGYFATCQTVVDVLDKNRCRPVTDLKPDDFRKLRTKLAETRGAVALRNEMGRVASIFKFGFDEGLILAPIRYGQGFARPKAEVVDREREKHRQEHGDRMFEAAELRQILAAAEQPLRTLVLLAANGGFGQTDLANLPLRAVDLAAGWLDFARVKTAVRRRIPLWPESVAAIRDWLPRRPKAKDKADAGLLFLTVRGARFIKVSAKGSPKDAIGQEFGKVLAKLGLKRSRRGFYSLRHGFETIGGELADQVAVDVLMGHRIKGMAAHYIERVGADRLQRVTEHVRAWLFGGGGPLKTNPGICDPNDPCDPPPVFPGENAQIQGRNGVANTAEPCDPLATLESPKNPEKMWGGSHGPQGSQTGGPYLRLFG